MLQAPRAPDGGPALTDHRPPATDHWYQLDLGLARTPEEFRKRLSAAGLGDEWDVRFTDNRTTMVSFRGRSVRVHRCYVDAPDPVVAAIARFVLARRRAERRDASRVIVAHAPPRTSAEIVPIRRRERTHPRDVEWARRLAALHHELNFSAFGGALSEIAVRVSRRMKRKLGHYCAATEHGPAEIAIGRWHIRHDPWSEVMHTMLHEMVHQWQDENGLPIAHDRAFRDKAASVGIDPRATRVDDVRPRLAVSG